MSALCQVPLGLHSRCKKKKKKKGVSQRSPGQATVGCKLTHEVKSIVRQISQWVKSESPGHTPEYFRISVPEAEASLLV